MSVFSSMRGYASRQHADVVRTGSGDPDSEYICRSEQRQQELARIKTRHLRLWAYFAAISGALVLIAVGVFLSHITPLWVVFAALALGSLIQALAKNAREYGRLERIVRFYNFGIARLQHRWQGRGYGGEEFLPAQHPYASDLDVFGEGSLFELLCTARTSVGRAMLASWLLNPAKPEEILERQSAVAELRDRLDLREEWASMGHGALAQVGSSVFNAWKNAPAVQFSLLSRTLAICLPICSIAIAVLCQCGYFVHYAYVAVGIPLLGQAILATTLIRKVRSTANNVNLPSFDLAMMAPLMTRIEQEHFECSLLRSLRLSLMEGVGRASSQIGILSVFVWLLELRRFEYFALFSSALLWGTNLTILIERWRQRNSVALSRWLDSVGQFEALLCLARFHYENPGHTFPTLTSGSTALLRAEALGHPLLDRKACIPCDVMLDAETQRLIMVSGSNMSGKSTLLRTVGINSVLAFAGGPVRAARLQIRPFRIGCSIAVHDSLSNSKSRFQAEVERLKYVLDLSRTGSVLFLLDEVLGGTNSKDRLVGVNAVINELLRNHAIGIVTTHDLALTDLVDASAGHAMNVHFEENYEDGEMRFDYKMRPGVLTRTNGLHVMSVLGLLPPG